MLSPAQSLSMIESGYESDPSVVILTGCWCVTQGESVLVKVVAASVGACLCYHLTIGRGLSGCFDHRSIVSSTSRR